MLWGKRCQVGNKSQIIFLLKMAPFHEAYTIRLKLEFKINKKNVINGGRFEEHNFSNSFNKSTLSNAFCLSDHILKNYCTGSKVRHNFLYSNRFFSKSNCTLVD